MLCNHCGNEVSDNAKFCAICGEKIVRTKFCDSCGEENDIIASFCSQCGKKLDNVENEESANSNSKDLLCNEEDCRKIFEQAERNYNARNWKEACKEFKMLLNSTEPNEWKELSYYYLAQIKLIDYWNSDYDITRQELSEYLHYGLEKRNILILL